MVREKIVKDLEKACQKLGLTYDKIVVEYPKDPSHGDYSTNLALRLAQGKLYNKKRPSQQVKIYKDGVWQSPSEIAKKIVEIFPRTDYLEGIKIIKPGFVNFYLSKRFLQSQVGIILIKKEKFASIDIGKEEKARVEFVSANPTGPLHIGNARGGPIGDTIANILEAAGYKVLREYIHNDIGGQVERFGKSLFALSQGEKLENQEYKGKYMLDLVKEVGKLRDWEDAASKGVKLMLGEILEDCKMMKIKFDQINYESEFVESGKTKKVLDELRKKRVVKEQEGALWFAVNSEFLKDRECVLVKSDGSFTYFANDIAYHKLKFSRGYDLIVDEFGAGHAGHVPRLQAALTSLGFDIGKIRFILHQNVRVKRGEKMVSMSKRAGDIITAREVLEEVGSDAFRFFMLMHDPATHMDFDLELAKKKSAKNPVYYVQYAYARICSILRKAGERKNFNPQPSTLNLLNHPTELALIKQLVKLPELVEDMARNFQAHKLTSYAGETANFFHQFYERCRVISDNKKLTQARLNLVLATKIVISASLKLMGVSTPERM